MCDRCYGRGWTPTWVDDPNDSYFGGHEGPEMYCDCLDGKRLMKEEEASDDDQVSVHLSSL